MTLTLLLDLDDTLLQNQIDAFLPAYLQNLGNSLAAYTEPQRMARALMQASQKMLQNRRPDQTLEQVFDAHFYPALGLEKADLLPTLNQFYAETFPTLRRLTQPKPQAIALVDWAMSKGYTLALATNPLFPWTAIRQRLDWAGLPAEQYPFILVPGFESFHFAKPEPAYYAELLAQIGCPNGPVVMVGDDLSNDIQAAQAAGLQTFWLHHQGQSAAPAGVPHGDFADLRRWLEETPTETLQPALHLRSAALAILRATPAALDTFCRQATPEQMSLHPEPEAWCPTEVLCHLRDVDIEVNLPRLRQFEDQHNPFLTVQNTDAWVQQRGYHDQDPRQALEVLTQRRVQLLETLEALPDAVWERAARHAIFGPTTLNELVGIIAEHDRLHLRQFLQALKISHFLLTKPG